MPNHQAISQDATPLADRSYFIASGIGGLISHIIAYPISTVVSRLQVSPLQSNQMHEVHSIVFPGLQNACLAAKTRSLYSGFLSGGLHKVSARTMRYGGQPILAAWLEKKFTRSAQQYFNPDESKIFFESSAGAAMAIAHVIVFAPLDNIKTKKQNGNLLPMLQLIQQERGNLYNGTPIIAALAKDIPKALTLFGTSSAVLTQLKKFNENKQEASLSQHIVSAMAGAFANVVISNPQSVIKARIQNQHNQAGCIGLFAMFRKTVQEEGFSALYKGISFRLLLAVPEKVLPLALASYLVSSWKKAREKEQASAPAIAPRM